MNIYIENKFLLKHFRYTIFVDAYSEDDNEIFFKASEDGDYDVVENLLNLYPNIVNAASMNSSDKGNTYHSRKQPSKYFIFNPICAEKGSWPFLVFFMQ